MKVQTCQRIIKAVMTNTHLKKQEMHFCLYFSAKSISPGNHFVLRNIGFTIRKYNKKINR